MKKTIQFTELEAEKLHVIKEIAEGVIKQVQWAAKLWIDVRQMRRLMKKRVKDWDTCVIHGLKWKWSNNHEYDLSEVQKIVHYPEYKWFWPTFMKEKLEEVHKIKICIETMRKILTWEWLRKPANKKHHIYRKRRVRKESIWDMVQFDWSYHLRFEDRWDECCLLVAIDDATSKLMHCKLTKWEWFAEVGQFWIEYILKYWVPQTIYVDRFSTYSVAHWKKREKDMITNFTRIMNSFWCEVIFANSPEAKWRVERVNGTLQNRLVKEMRLAWISSPEQWNQFLTEIYIPKHNQKFAVQPANELDTHHTNQYTQDELDMIFAQVYVRILGNDYIINYNSKVYQVYEWEYAVYPKKKIEVYQTHLWVVYMKVNDSILKIKELDAEKVKRERAIYRYKQNKIKAEKQKIELEARRNRLHEISKQRQEARKQSKLIST